MAGAAGPALPWAAVGPTYRPTATPPISAATTSGMRNERVIARSPPVLVPRESTGGRRNHLGRLAGNGPVRTDQRPRTGPAAGLLYLSYAAGPPEDRPRPARRRIDTPATFWYKPRQNSLAIISIIMAQDVLSTEAEVLEECQAAIGYRFRQPELLRSALTHTSGAN